MNKIETAEELVRQIDALENLDVDYQLKNEVYNKLWQRFCDNLNERNKGKECKGIHYVRPVPMPDKNEWYRILEDFKESKFAFLQKRKYGTINN